MWKKIFIGFLLLPLGIFGVGVMLILLGVGTNFIFHTNTSSKSKTTVPSVTSTTSKNTSAAPTGSVVSAPHIAFKTTYYNPTGSTRDEIRANMTALRQGTFLVGHDAATTSKIDINFQRRQLSGTCETRMSQFDLTLTYTYPKWTPPANIPPELIAQWNIFIAALKVHEEGHANIEISRVKELFTALKSIGTYATCDEFDRVWQAKADTMDAETKKIEAKYDQDTKGGQTQGVRF